ncbi:hypothetical protein [Solimonas soli]|uniref:hypothetical protein n=1 Tax=Solimonas soli TaxID=413479 RepID=UPI0012FADC6B|nr:hypothetical protein [Solimonas soli]
MPRTNEDLPRVQIAAQLNDQGWNVLDSSFEGFECTLYGRVKADYILRDRKGRVIVAIDAKKNAGKTVEEAQ